MRWFSTSSDLRTGTLPPVGFVVALVLLVAGWFAVGPWILAALVVAVVVPATRRLMRVVSRRWV